MVHCIISWFTKIKNQDWFAFQVLVYPGCLGKTAVKQMLLIYYRIHCDLQ